MRPLERNRMKRLEVHELSSGRVWPTITAFSKHIGLSSQSITIRINRGDAIKGRHYVLKESDRATHSRRVIRLSDGKEYASIKEAATENGISRHKIGYQTGFEVINASSEN